MKGVTQGFYVTGMNGRHIGFGYLAAFPTLGDVGSGLNFTDSDIFLVHQRFLETVSTKSCSSPGGLSAGRAYIALCG